MRVAIIGAGISGLALAYYLQRLGIPYDLLEASPRAGGHIRTLRLQDFMLELGPPSFQKSPELEELLTELKLEQVVVPAAVAAHHRFVVREGALQKLPDSPLSLLSSSLFSWKTKRRILEEKDIPPAAIPNETISRFFERRFGKEAATYALNPLAAEHCGGDPEKLVLSKALPQLKELETKYGSVLRGLLKKQHSWPDSFSFRDGMHTLPDAIAAKLISLHLEHRVELVTRDQGKYILSCSAPAETDVQEYDFLVLALPAHQAADLLQFTFPGLSAALLNINYLQQAVVHSAFNRADVGHTLQGYGAWHPVADAAAASHWTSSVFPGRCQPHQVLFTTFVHQPALGADGLVNQPELLANVTRELCRSYNICTGKPVFEHLHVWRQAMPQYDLFIEDAHQLARQLEQQHLFIAANWQAGVRVSSCIRHAKELAYKINLKRADARNSL